jgi:hypothetical protein
VIERDQRAVLNRQILDVEERLVIHQAAEAAILAEEDK